MRAEGQLLLGVDCDSGLTLEWMCLLNVGISVSVVADFLSVARAVDHCC